MLHPVTPSPDGDGLTSCIWATKWAKRSPQLLFTAPFRAGFHSQHPGPPFTEEVIRYRQAESFLGASPSSAARLQDFRRQLFMAPITRPAVPANLLLPPGVQPVQRQNQQKQGRRGNQERRQQQNPAPAPAAQPRPAPAPAPRMNHGRHR